MAVYDPNRDIDVKDIVKLELGANVPVLTKLQPKLNELSKRALFLPQDHDGYRVHGIDLMTVKYIHSWVEQWHLHLNCLKPSWKNFCMILGEISPDLGELADQIEAYFDQYSIQPNSEGTESKGTILVHTCCEMIENFFVQVLQNLHLQ